MARNNRCVKGQSMAELAIFGGILLMVLAFLVRYAMSMNSSQKLRMETYKIALNKAYVGTDLNQTNIYRDASSADPQDMFGFSPRTVNSASDYVVWTDSQNKTTDPPGINYTFVSGKDKNNHVFSKTYTTSGKIGYNVSAVQMDYPFFDGPIIVDKLKEYKVNDPDGQLKLLVDALAEGDCTEAYCPTDIASSADLDHDGNSEDVLSANGEGTVSGDSRDYQEGEIDTGKMSPWEYLEDYQGVRPPKVTVTRSDTMTNSDSSGSLSSSNALSETTTNQYEIRLNKGGSQQVTLSTTETNGWTISGSK